MRPPDLGSRSSDHFWLDGGVESVLDEGSVAEEVG